MMKRTLLFGVAVSIALLLMVSKLVYAIADASNCSPMILESAKSIGLDSVDQTQFFPTLSQDQYKALFSEQAGAAAEGFDYPVGKPDAKGYYKALVFGQRLHLGEDWNGNGGGDTDLGDPVYATANGIVIYANDICCGWGNTVRMVHYLPDDARLVYVESIYSHLQNIFVKSGEVVKRGQKIGTIGNANGRYAAHLHFEMRDFVGMSIGPGYSEDQFGYLDPTNFINDHRPK